MLATVRSKNSWRLVFATLVWYIQHTYIVSVFSRYQPAGFLSSRWPQAATWICTWYALSFAKKHLFSKLEKYTGCTLACVETAVSFNQDYPEPTYVYVLRTIYTYIYIYALSEASMSSTFTFSSLVQRSSAVWLRMYRFHVTGWDRSQWWATATTTGGGATTAKNKQTKSRGVVWCGVVWHLTFVPKHSANAACSPGPRPLYRPLEQNGKNNPRY